MNKTICISIVLFITLFSCKDKSVDSGNDQTPIFSSQSSTCVHPGLAKGSAVDSVFTYTFGQTLSMDFSIWANCCPDSGRFVVNHAIQSDTIIITVADTAQNLCRCTCPYFIHVEVFDLPQDQYIVRCQVGDSVFFDLAHLVIVRRNI